MSRLRGTSAARPVVIDRSTKARLMPPTHLCIFARPMSRPVRRSCDNRKISVILLVVLVGALFGCDDLDGRGQNRVGNRRFRESRFIDAAAAYERAIAKVKDDKIEYNIGLAYQKMFKPGVEGVILLAETGSP